MTASRAVLIALALAAGACAPRAFVRPSGPALPAPDAATIWLDASAACRGLAGVQAALGLTGRVRDQRIPGLAGATLYVAVSSVGDIGLEARVSAQLVFKLGGNAARATLYLPADNRVVVAPAADIVDALVGVRLGPERLLATLGGCVSRASTVDRAARYGQVLEVTTPDATVFLEQRAGVWTPRAGFADDLTIDYRRRGEAIREVALQSAPGRQAGVAISLQVKQLDLAPALAPELFAVIVPEDARPMSLEELRSSGLLDAGDRR
jgi:hypothetical protein